MVDNLALFATTARIDIKRLRAVLGRLPSGRGQSLAQLAEFVLAEYSVRLDELDADVELIHAEDLGAAERERLLSLMSKRYERFQPLLDIVYEILGIYEKSIGRSDVPVGLQHLIDVLVVELVRYEADPMIHLDPVDMYSTVDLVAQVSQLVEGPEIDPGVKERYAGPHPIVFNLPALDPGNALLSPLIAHEVTHSAADDVLLEELMVRVGASSDALLAKHLDRLAAAGTQIDAQDWGDTFTDWCEELLCDAVALALTGPSFLFAFTAYLPPTGVAMVSTHPHLRDRVQFHLTVLSRLGWLQPLRDLLPTTMQWFQEVGAAVPRTKSPKEAFLLEAMRLVEGAIVDIAVGYVQSPLIPRVLEPARRIVPYFREGIPAIDIEGQLLGTWEVVLTGWLAAFEERGDAPPSLLVAIDDENYSAMLIKALEMSSIVSKWRKYSDAAS